MTDPHQDLQQKTDGQLRRILQSTAAPTPEAARLQAFLAEYRTLHPRTSPLQRLANWFKDPHWLPAPTIAAVASLLVIAQGVIIAQLLPGADTHGSAYRGTVGQLSTGNEAAHPPAAARCGSGPLIRVTFRPAAPHGEVIILLRKLEARLVSGPAENGELYFALPAGQSFDDAIALLKSSGLVDDAILHPAATPCP